MKKILLGSLFCIGGMLAATGQNNIEKRETLGTPVNLKYVLETNSTSRSAAVTCAAGAIDYSTLKEETAGTATYYTVPIAGPRIASTAFYLDQAATISQIYFIGFSNDKTNPVAIPVSIGIWNVDAAGKPTTLITSMGGTATTNLTNPVNMYTLTTPVSVTDSFAVTVQPIATGDTISIYINDAGTSGTYDEGLSWRQSPTGTWFTMTALYGAEYEFLIAPVASFDIASSFTSSDTTVCSGTAVNFTNTSSSILGNRMFNVHAFETAWAGEVDSTFVWNFGDLSPLEYSKNPTHTYALAGTYTVTLTARAKGYYTAGCSEVMTKVINVYTGPAVSNFTANGTSMPTYSFTNTSVNSDSYKWDFGDGSPTVTTANPTHTYTANNTYTVTLISYNPCENDTSTQAISITTGINQNSYKIATVFYESNSSTLQINDANNTSLAVFNVLGKIIYSEEKIYGSKSLNIGLTNGTYFVRTQSDGIVKTSKFVVTR